MKKKKLIALFTSLFCAASLPAFAAQNPFSDVPADHWSYDALSQLTQDGIIEGYGDGTFRGQQPITRYEMAQMVAKAMANHPNVTGNDKALLDKLTTEYSDELQNLGVRVANLERNADGTKFSGYFYLREQSQHLKDKRAHTAKTNSVNSGWLDLVMTNKVNDHWNVVGETNTMVDYNKDKVNDNLNLDIAAINAEGTYGKFKTQIGKINNYTMDAGLVMHASFSGAKVSFGNKLQTVLTAARMSNNLASLNKGESFDFDAAELRYKTSPATNLYGAYYYLHDDKFKATRGSEHPSIYTLGFQSKIAKNLRLTGYYLKASDTSNLYHKDTGYYGALEYRTINLQNPGTWSLYTKYAFIPELTQLSMDVGHFRDYKGVEIGGFYIPAKNMRAHLRYYYGKNVEDTMKTKSLIRGELRIFF